jgi:ketoreductase
MGEMVSPDHSPERRGSKESNMSDHERRVALVTGGTSGIGLAVTEILAARGNKVFICARTADTVALTVKRLREEGREVAGATCDIRSPEEVRAFVAAAVKEYGTVDILVNNAGRSGGGITADLTDELWFDVVNTNLNGTFLMTHAVLNIGGMREKSRGRIVNIASTAGKQGVVFGAPYTASKHGVVGFTKSLGNELAKSGITVNAVCPGYVETPMAQAIRERFAKHFETTPDAILQQFQAKIPLGRYSSPAEVAGLVGYLVSDSAASITAQAINVCGGLGNF